MCKALHWDFSKKCKVTLPSKKIKIIFKINLGPLTIKLVFLVDVLINFQVAGFHCLRPL